MLTNREALQKARQWVQERSRQDYGLLGAYVYGSALREEYLLGGAGDVDLVLVHMGTPERPQEIVPLGSEVHLDIRHHDQREYLQPRALRLHPWLGPALQEGSVLFDPQHFLDFTQASVRGQYYRPDFVYGRARRFLEQVGQPAVAAATEQTDEPAALAGYLEALQAAANAVASLSGPPLGERRLLLEFPGRAAEIGRPGLAQGLLGLLGAPRLTPEQVQSWLPAWQEAWAAQPTATADPDLQPERLAYYRQALRALLDSEMPLAALWPLWRTWTRLAAGLPAEAPARQTWQQAAQQAGLLGELAGQRHAALQAFLTLVEETLQDWGRQAGI